MHRSKFFPESTPVVRWLYTGVAMLVVQVLLGGITRLTGSGLSITEWKPILGTFPPLSEEAWRDAFAKYQQIGQFRQLNSHFSLDDFKAIYFWEWLHRNWARLMGLVFIVPFAYFLLTKKISRSMIEPMIILFLLGGLQGMIGWIMVESGLNLTSLYVDHIRLAIHFVAAMLLIAYLLWFALKTSIPEEERKDMRGIKGLNLLLIVLVFIQLIYGAFMAGSHAALAAPTWPTINYQWIPENMVTGDFLISISQNLITIQFIHRGLAYIILIIVLAHWFRLRSAETLPCLRKVGSWPLVLVILQGILGITALVKVLQPWVMVVNVLHQLVGMLLLMSLIVTLFLSKRGPV